MSKNVLITEKPSVAMQFATAMKIKANRKDGYLESDNWIITWCVGHLVTMSYPEKYDEKLKYWKLETLPFLPKEYKYEVIPAVEKQFNTIKSIVLRDDVDTIYVSTDSGREGEYIYRLVDQMIGIKGKNKKRVWIDSQTEEEILRGIKEAKDLEEYVRPGLKREYKTFTIHPKSKHKVEFNSYRLANTYINHAYQTTSKESSKKNPYVEKIIWVSGHDNRVCPTCLERDGQLFDKNTVPLDHPLGRCTYEYYIPKSMEQIATELKDWSQGGKNKQLDEWFNEYGIDFM